MDTHKLDSEQMVEAFQRVVKTIQEVRDLPMLLTTIMQESQELLDSETSSIFLYDEENDDLFFEVVVGDLNVDSPHDDTGLQLHTALGNGNKMRENDWSWRDILPQQEYNHQHDHHRGCLPLHEGIL